MQTRRPSEGFSLPFARFAHLVVIVYRSVIHSAVLAECNKYLQALSKLLC